MRWQRFVSDKRGTCLPCAAGGRLINTVSERGEYVVRARGGCWLRYYHPQCEPPLPGPTTVAAGALRL